MNKETQLPSTDTEEDKDDGSLRPREGWHVLHLFYHVEQSQWDILDHQGKIAAETGLTELIQEIRSHPETQLLAFSMLTPKADIGFMLLTPDLQDANEFEKRLSRSLGADVLAPTYSYLSMTEQSEYATSEDEYGEGLEKRDIKKGTAEYDEEIVKFHQHIAKYTQDRLYPNMPDWPVYCFYPMSKRRGQDGQNWYASSFEKRKALMKGHAAIGRTWTGKIRQLITGSVGLDDMEWGVTLFANDTHDVKGIVYQMRFDEVSSQYAEFGDFYIGIQLPLDQLFRRVLG